MNNTDINNSEKTYRKQTVKQASRKVETQNKIYEKIVNVDVDSAACYLHIFCPIPVTNKCFEMTEIGTFLKTIW